MSDQTMVRSVGRAIDILMILTEGPMLPRIIADRAALPKGTVYRLLATLAHRALVIQAPDDGSYALGPACFRFVDAMAQGFGGLAPLAHDVLEWLRETSGETATLHVRVGSQRICVAEFPSLEVIRFTAGVGSSAPIHSGAAGKTLLAYLPATERSAVLALAPLQSLTEFTRTDPGTLEVEFEQIIRDGYAHSSGERVVGAAAVSFPVFNADGRITCALSALGPDFRITPDRLEDLIAMVGKAAESLTNRLAELQNSEEGSE